MMTTFQTATKVQSVTADMPPNYTARVGVVNGRNVFEVFSGTRAVDYSMNDAEDNPVTAACEARQSAWADYGRKSFARLLHI